VVRVTAKSLILGSVAIMILSVTSGCYTVFQKKTLDGKPHPEITAEAEDRFSGDVAFRNYTHERWSHYLVCPWWEESIFLSKSPPDEDPDELEVEERIVGDEEPVLIIVDPPVLEHIIRVPSMPASSPDAEDADARYKSTDEDNESAPQAEPSGNDEPKPGKPSRRDRTGGRR